MRLVQPEGDIQFSLAFYLFDNVVAVPSIMLLVVVIQIWFDFYLRLELMQITRTTMEILRCTLLGV